MLCHERIDARLSDAEMLVMSGADVGDPHAFLRGLWAQVYDHAPMHLRSSVLRRLHALSRRLGVNYVHGEAVNGESSENVAVAWAPIAELARFIPTDRIYPPILDALEATV